MRRDRSSSSNRHLSCRWRFLSRLSLFWSGVAIAAILLIFLHLQFPHPTLAQVESQPSSRLSLPTPQVHPLPPTLAQWQDSTNQGDYFSEISSTELGYLVWSRFPVKIYVQPPTEEWVGGDYPGRIASHRAQAWFEAVTQAIQEWNAYLPLEQIDSSEAADISLWRSTPPIEGWQEGNLRARSAETRYQIYRVRSANAPAYLTQRFNILLRPSQTDEYIRAAARHELGHALGIWGHSLSETDALYFSQVRNPPQISIRDVNTLKRIYEQPTQLGWALD